MQHENSALVLVGGGRWARVTLAVLAGLEIPFAKVIVIARHGGDALAGAIAQANLRRPGRFAQAQDLDAVLRSEKVTAALVVNAARDHARIAQALLARKIPLLVEKPVALTVEEAAHLIDAAKTSGTLLMPGHIFSFCAYLENFSAAARRTLGPLRAVTMHWRDAAGEKRYGESKSFDASLGVVEDVGPHLFTILSMLLSGTEARIEKTAIARGGLAVEVQGQWHETAFTLVLERDAASRERLIVLKDASGNEARLDFAVEPGTMVLDGQSASADPQWPHAHGPLALQLLNFLQATGMPPRDLYLDAIRDSTHFVTQIAQQVRAAQEDLIGSADAVDQLVAVRELLAPLLMAAGHWRAGDNESLEALAREAVRTMAATTPRPTLADLVRDLRSGA